MLSEAEASLSVFLQKLELPNNGVVGEDVAKKLAELVGSADLLLRMGSTDLADIKRSWSAPSASRLARVCTRSSSNVAVQRLACYD